MDTYGAVIEYSFTAPIVANFKLTSAVFLAFHIVKRYFML